MPQALNEWTPELWPVADGWRPLVDQFLACPEGQRLAQAIRQRLDGGAIIYPPEPFKALELTPLAAVKVVILGQDPYHGQGQAHGLAFSVCPGTKLPPSLRNIIKELVRDPLVASGDSGFDGSLSGWAGQGVLLLNTSLTVEDGSPASHARLGWEALTDALLRAVMLRDKPVVFLLWGAHAQAHRELIDDTSKKAVASHLVLTANHPSPLSALRSPKPFVGCGHFGMANEFLSAHQCTPIDWTKFVEGYL